MEEGADGDWHAGFRGDLCSSLAKNATSRPATKTSLQILEEMSASEEVVNRLEMNAEFNKIVAHAAHNEQAHYRIQIYRIHI